MSNMYTIARELHGQLKKVKVELQRTKWTVREVGSRWKCVGSSVKSVLLRNFSLAKTLYTCASSSFATHLHHLVHPYSLSPTSKSSYLLCTECVFCCAYSVTMGHVSRQRDKRSSRLQNSLVVHLAVQVPVHASLA